ncbi:MAG: hypothetical protein IKD72_06495, partial [Clostridia bacterium]|nr:hypothetical protein [Clostridia bacterium]
MKRRSILYRGLVTLISALMTVAGVHADVFAAAVTVQMSDSCPKSGCSEHLHVSGPYANLDDIVDPVIPYFGGKTYREVCADPGIGLVSNFEKYHMYIFYCPHFNYEDDTYTRHTMTVLFPQHGYSVAGYTPRDAAGHDINYVCDHSNIDKFSFSQELCGSYALVKDAVWKGFLRNDTQGCGATRDEYETHRWTYGQWTEKDETQHERTKTCVRCGYTVMQTAAHKPTPNDYVSIDAATHRRTDVCTDCGAFSYATEAHTFVYGEWQFTTDGYNNARQHFRTVTCSKCGYETTQYADHQFVYRSEAYAPYSEIHHYRVKDCTVCGMGISEYTL